MIGNINLIASTIAFSIGIVITFLNFKKEKGDYKTIFTGLLLSSAVALFPIYFMGLFSNDGSPFENVLLSALSVLSSVTGNNSVFDTREMLSMAGNLTIISSVYVSILHLVSATTLFGAVLSISKQLFPKFYFNHFARGDIYIFSTLCPRTIALATDIRVGSKKAIILFLGSLSESDEQAPEYREAVDRLKAFNFNWSLTDLHFNSNLKRAGIRFFMFKDNETDNLTEAIALSKKYRDADYDIKIYIKNSNPEAEMIIRDLHGKKLIMQLYDESKNVISDLFDEKPLFLGMRENGVTVLVLGSTPMSMEAIRTATYCGQTIKTSPKIIVVDSDPDAKSRFLSVAPGYAHSVADCEIEFYTCDANSIEFRSILEKHHDIGYVICATQDELLNVRAGINVTSIFEGLRHKYSKNGVVNDLPLVTVHIKSSNLIDICRSLYFSERVPCNLFPFGDIANTYSVEKLLTRRIDSFAFAVTRFYHSTFNQAYSLKNEGLLTHEQEQAFIDNTTKQAHSNYSTSYYTQKSAIAQALRIKSLFYSVLCEEKGLSTDDFDWGDRISDSMLQIYSEALVSEELVEKLCACNYKGFVHYMLSEGWCNADLETTRALMTNTCEPRNHVAKLMPTLVKYEELGALSECLKQELSINVDYQSFERTFILGMPMIIKSA